MEINTIKILSHFEPNTKSIDIYNKDISGILCLIDYKKLIELSCSHNKITQLSNFPECLVYLYCSYNQIKSLDNLPPNITDLNCSTNQISQLTNLPNNLSVLYCSNNQLTNLDLPKQLKELKYS